VHAPWRRLRSVLGQLNASVRSFACGRKRLFQVCLFHVCLFHVAARFVTSSGIVIQTIVLRYKRRGADDELSRARCVG
jgi:hypothetical protein